MELYKYKDRKLDNRHFSPLQTDTTALDLPSVVRKPVSIE